MRLKPLLLTLLGAVFVCTLATTVQAHDPAPTHQAITVQAPDCPHSGGDMRVLNTSPRLVHFTIRNEGQGHGIEKLLPNQEREFSGDLAAEIKQHLEGTYKALVDNGSLVVDGKPKAPPPTLPTPQVAYDTEIPLADSGDAATSASTAQPDTPATERRGKR